MIRTHFTLLIDANYFLHRTYAVGCKIAERWTKLSKEEKDAGAQPLDFTRNPEEDHNTLLWKLALDLASQIKNFGVSIDSIVYCIDSTSWRKGVEIPFDEHYQIDYKGNRVRSSKVDWKEIYKTHDAFVEGLTKMGVVKSRIAGAEADDLMFSWSTNLNELGRNCIILSGDKDLHQLVNGHGKDGSITICKNPTNNIFYVPTNFDEWLESGDTYENSLGFDVLLGSDPIKLAISDITERASKVVKINPDKFVFKKIMIGDAGDNVPPIFKRTKTSSNGQTRTYGVTEREAKIVLEEFQKKYSRLVEGHIFNDDHITEICDLLRKTKKIDNVSTETLTERYKINRDLMCLHNRCIPSEIVDAMRDDVLSRVEDTGRILTFDRAGMTVSKSILEMCDYDASKDNQQSGSSSSIFGSIGV